MSESILNSIKHMFGPDDDYQVFDQDFVLLINGSLAQLQDYGAGPSDPFFITGDTETWDDFDTDKYVQNMGKNFIFHSIKMGWDQPSAGFVLKAHEDMRNELGWRIEAYCTEHK